MEEARPGARFKQQKIKEGALRNPKAKEGSLAFLPSSPPSHQETFQFPQFHNKVKKKKERIQRLGGLMRVYWGLSGLIPETTLPLPVLFGRTGEET